MTYIVTLEQKKRKTEFKIRIPKNGQWGADKPKNCLCLPHRNQLHLRHKCPVHRDLWIKLKQENERRPEMSASNIYVSSLSMQKRLSILERKAYQKRFFKALNVSRCVYAYVELYWHNEESNITKAHLQIQTEAPEALKHWLAKYQRKYLKRHFQDTREHRLRDLVYFAFSTSPVGHAIYCETTKRQTVDEATGLVTGLERKCVGKTRTKQRRSADEKTLHLDAPDEGYDCCDFSESLH